MRLERVTSIRQLKTGDSVICLIEGDEVTDCKIYIERKKRKVSGIYLCQNERCGRECSDLLGYDYSWIFYGDWHRSLEEGLTTNRVTGLRKVVKGET